MSMSFSRSWESYAPGRPAASHGFSVGRPTVGAAAPVLFFSCFCGFPSRIRWYCAINAPWYASWCCRGRCPRIFSGFSSRCESAEMMRSVTGPPSGLAGHRREHGFVRRVAPELEHAERHRLATVAHRAVVVEDRGADRGGRLECRRVLVADGLAALVDGFRHRAVLLVLRGFGHAVGVVEHVALDRSRHDLDDADAERSQLDPQGVVERADRG